MTLLRRGNFKRETQILLIATKNNAIRTNYVKVGIYKTKQNSKCWLCDDRDEMINHIISECSKLVQKDFKSRHVWVGKGICWELCKKFKFDYTNKWYIHNPESVQNSQCRLRSDEMINYIISGCSKLVQKEYKTRHDWVGKGIHWELCKKFKFDHTKKCYMHNPEPVLENETYKLLCDFEMQTDP